MHKQLRIFGIICAVAVMTFLSIYTAMNLLIRHEIESIESTAIQQATTRAIDALDQRLSEYKTKISDWSSWDDSYAFVVNKNANFISSNLNDNTLTNLGTDYIIYFDRNGSPVQLSSQKPLTTATKSALLGHLSTDSGLLATSDESEQSGYLKMPEGPLMFVAKPILDSDGNGPYRGTIVFAHYLTQNDITNISAINHLNINYFDKTKLPDDIKPYANTLSTDTSTIVRINDNQIEGYQYINDAYGEPYLVAEISQDRSSYLSAKRALRYFSLTVVIVLVVASAIILWVVRIISERDETIRLKDEFFSIASHEIRTPLTAIKGNAQLLDQMYGDKNGQGFVEIVSDVKTSSDRLVRLVTNYLDAARLEQGKIIVSPENVTLRVVTQEVADELQGVATNKGVSIVNGVQDAALRGYADKGHIKQVLYNLIGNALKFTEKGTITVTAQKSGTGMIDVFIADTGRGVPESGKAALFKKFEQAAKDDAAQGSGLGLYISKLLVEKMGGVIRLVSSEEGKGTTISFSLPAAATANNTDKPSEEK